MCFSSAAGWSVAAVELRCEYSSHVVRDVGRARASKEASGCLLFLPQSLSLSLSPPFLNFFSRATTVYTHSQYVFIVGVEVVVGRRRAAADCNLTVYSISEEEEEVDCCCCRLIYSCFQKEQEKKEEEYSYRMYTHNRKKEREQIVLCVYTAVLQVVEIKRYFPRKKKKKKNMLAATRHRCNTHTGGPSSLSASLSKVHQRCKSPVVKKRRRRLLKFHRKSQALSVVSTATATQ